MRQASLTPEFVEFIPERLEDGVLYISEKYGTATHRCCCGCGQEVVTPLGPADWKLQVLNDGVTLYPSIGNWSFVCRSHYWIRNGRVIWAGAMTQQQIARGRMLDRHARDNYIAGVNRQKGGAPPMAGPPAPVQQPPDWIDTTWKAIKTWLGLRD
ncbi:MAG: DUF6527 family protein [Gammaproteobacteria bacterium]